MNRRDRDQLAQGRTDAQKLAAEKGARIIFGLIGAALLVLVIAALVLLIGMRIAHAETCPNGAPVVIGTGPCQEDGRANPGCYSGGVAYAQSQAGMGHECQHAAGMRHTRWVRIAASFNCAVVTQAGGGLREGQLICQRMQWVGNTSIADTNAPFYVESDPKMMRWARERLAEGQS